MTVTTYLVYLLVAVPLTVWVARVLGRNGRVFLVQVFHGNDELADAVNRLLVVGFYLVNVGFVTVFLRVSDSVDDARVMIEQLSMKLGIVMLVLGVVHFLNVYVFNALRRRSQIERLMEPPLPPDATLPMPPR